MTPPDHITDTSAERPADEIGSTSPAIVASAGTDLEQEVVESLEARENAYASQPATVVAPAKRTSKKAKGTGDVTENVEAAPKPSRSRVGDKFSEQITHLFDGDKTKIADNLILDVAHSSLSEAVRYNMATAMLDAVDNSAKKVGEKAANIIFAFQDKANISAYTKIAFKLLHGAGEVTASDIKNAYLAVPYSAGTAAAQTSQMMLLFPLLGIASRNGSKLTYNKDSVFGTALADALA